MLHIFKTILAIVVICAFGVGTGFFTLTAAVGLSGFWIGTAAVFVVWILGIISGQLYVEAFLAVPQAKHFYSLSRSVSSVWGSRSLTFVFLFFSYCLMIFYILFIHDVIRLVIEHYQLQPYIEPHHVMFPLIGILGTLIYFGHLPTFVGIAAAFTILLTVLGIEIVKVHEWTPPVHAPLSYDFYFLMTLGAAFNITFYQSILPSLIVFLERNRRQILSTIWIGWSAAMLLYLIWLWITIRPEIYGKFLAAFESKSSFRAGFAYLQQLSHFKFIVRALAASAGVISIMSIAIALMDFLEDALSHYFPKNKRLSRLLFTLLIFIPPLLLRQLTQKHMISFTTITSAFTEFLLATVYPLSWVWNIRYRLRLPIRPVLKGGKPVMIGIIFASVLLFLILMTVPINQLYW